MKASFKTMWLLASLGILMVLAIGCNDTLRQFIVPVPGPAGDHLIDQPGRPPRARCGRQ
jgi:hypothetical protein